MRCCVLLASSNDPNTPILSLVLPGCQWRNYALYQRRNIPIHVSAWCRTQAVVAIQNCKDSSKRLNWVSTHHHTDVWRQTNLMKKFKDPGDGEFLNIWRWSCNFQLSVLLSHHCLQAVNTTPKLIPITWGSGFKTWLCWTKQSFGGEGQLTWPDGARARGGEAP